MNGICTSMGDCGNKPNYIGQLGDQKNAITIINQSLNESK